MPRCIYFPTFLFRNATHNANRQMPTQANQAKKVKLAKLVKLVNLKVARFQVGS